MLVDPVRGADATDHNTDSATADQPLSFEFIHQPPGKLISVGTHRLHIHCIGEGEVTVLFESGLGGVSIEWDALQKSISRRTRTCTYDRGGYGWSDPALDPRDAQSLSKEVYLLLNNLNIRGRLLLVSHSFGGFISRAVANRITDRIVGLVLLDTSHERQFDTFEAVTKKTIMPTGASFVISPIPIPKGLPTNIRRKMQGFSRMRKTYSAVYGEMKYFRDSALQVQSTRRVYPFPVVVIRRGRQVNGDDEKGQTLDALWDELQIDLATLSESDGSVTIADDSGHHIHVDQPQLVIDKINHLLDTAE